MNKFQGLKKKITIGHWSWKIIEVKEGRLVKKWELSQTKKNLIYIFINL